MLRGEGTGGGHLDGVDEKRKRSQGMIERTMRELAMGLLRLELMNVEFCSDAIYRVETWCQFRDSKVK